MTQIHADFRGLLDIICVDQREISATSVPFSGYLNAYNFDSHLAARRVLTTTLPRVIMTGDAPVAQRTERLPSKQRVRGSNPFRGAVDWKEH